MGADAFRRTATHRSGRAWPLARISVYGRVCARERGCGCAHRDCGSDRRLSSLPAGRRGCEEGPSRACGPLYAALSKLHACLTARASANPSPSGETLVPTGPSRAHHADIPDKSRAACRQTSEARRTGDRMRGSRIQKSASKSGLVVGSGTACAGLRRRNVA